MNESAKFELEKRISLYQFYLDLYTKGIAFFLTITGALRKFAFDSQSNRNIFVGSGLLATIVFLIPLAFGLFHARTMQKDFNRLGDATGTVPFSVSPLQMLVSCVAVFWILVFGGWVYIIAWLK
jgi:hypothetical protein